MDPILQQIGARRAYLAEQVERLGQQMAAAEAELAEVTVAAEVVTRLLADADTGGHSDAAPEMLAEPRRVVPFRKDAAGLADLSAENQRVLREVAQAAGPIRCKPMCERLGIGTEPRKVEAIRARMKRLAERGWLREQTPGEFTMPT